MRIFSYNDSIMNYLYACMRLMNYGDQPRSDRNLPCIDRGQLRAIELCARVIYTLLFIYINCCVGNFQPVKCGTIPKTVSSIYRADIQNTPSYICFIYKMSHTIKNSWQYPNFHFFFSNLTSLTFWPT